MRKSLKVGAGLMLAAWLPFLYAELTSEPAEKEARALPSDDGQEDAVPAGAAGEDEEGTAGTAEHEPEPAAPQEGQEKPAAEGAQPTPMPTPTTPTPTAAPAQAPGEPGATLEEPAATADPAEPHPGDDPEGDTEEEEEPLPPATSGPVTVMKHAYDGQPRDPLWAADTEGKLRALFGGEDVPADLLGAVSCRKAVCRMDLEWAPARATAYVSVYQASAELSGSEVAVEAVGTPAEDASQKVQLYILRKGYTVADLSR